jgi:DNA-binding transcriptional regulator YiaG
MPNVASLLKEEISRLSRREIRKHVATLRKIAAAHRRDIAAIKRQLIELQRRTAALARRKDSEAGSDSRVAERPLRFVAKGLRSLRTRLGLSAPALAQLINVSTQTIYNWEHKKANPRKEQLTRLAALRLMGKREAKARLDTIANAQVRKHRKSR